MMCPGKTISKQVTLLNQGQNPLITKATTIATQMTRTPTQTSIPATTQTLVSTTVATPLPTEPPTMPPTTAATQVPSTGQTQAPGFGVTLACAAFIFGLVLFLRKE